MRLTTPLAVPSVQGGTAEVFAAAADRGRSVSPAELTQRLLRPSPAGARQA